MPAQRARLIALLVGWTALACNAPIGFAPTSAPANTPTPVIPTVTMLISTATPASTFDRQFIDAVVPLHEASIQMALVALERGQHPAIQELVQDIMTTQSAEIEDMRAWREAWFGSRATPSISQAPLLLEPGAPVAVGTTLTLDLAAEIEALRNAPEPFDPLFVTTMRTLQQRTQDAATLAIRRARQQEILDLSGTILAEHQRWERALADLI